MADNFMDHVRLRRVERRRVMTNVLSAEKHSVGEVFQKDSRLHQTSDWFQSKTADRLHFHVDLAQLRNASVIETQSLQRREILGARIFLMRRAQRCPDRLPNEMLL